MMQKHEKDDLAKYKKLQLNVAGIRDYVFDSYGNPITAKPEKPVPTDVEIIKPEFNISKKVGPRVISPYYLAAYQQKIESKNKFSFLPPVGNNKEKRQPLVDTTLENHPIPNNSSHQLLPPHPGKSK